MRSVRNAISVVEALDDAGVAGVAELARRTGIPKTTVQRCLETLHEAGWIHRADSGDEQTRWRLSRLVVELGDGGGRERLVRAAVPHLEALRDAAGDAVHLVALDGTDVVLLHREPGPGPLQVVLPDGFRVPAHAAATGKSILSMLTEEELARRLPVQLDRLTSATVIDHTRLREELTEVRSRGWATNVGEWEPSVAAVAAPVVVRDAVVAAISVSTTPSRLDADRLPQIAALVVAAAAAVNDALG